MDRRLFLLASASVPGLLVERGSRVNVAPEVVDEFERATARLIDGYPRTPVPVTAQAARRELPVVRAVLSQGALPAAARRRLHAVTGRLTAVLGNAALDAGCRPAASRTLVRADEHARLGADPTNQAWVRLLQACVENQDDRPEAALAYARDGYRRAPAGSPVAARLAAEGIAFPLAVMGDRRGASEALDAAWRTVEDLPPSRQGVPGWHPEHLHPGELDSITAAVYNAAGDPDSALVHTGTGVRLLDDSDAIGHRAYVRVNAANALFDRGEVEPAADHLHEALRLSRDRPLAEIGDCAERFIVRARARGVAPALTDDLGQRLHEWRGPG